MVTDGDGWVRCDQGHQHWGRYGAAGLLALAPATALDERAVLMQHRAPWSHSGDTWGVPGGALASAGETAEQAARRECVEETGLDLSDLEIIGTHLSDHGAWAYTTFVGTVPSRLAVVSDYESIALRWVTIEAVTELSLHPAFAAAWPALQALLP